MSDTSTKTDRINEWLAKLRAGTARSDDFLLYLREDLWDARLSLADIGTSEQELADCRRRGAQIRAERRLDRIRSGRNNGSIDFVLLEQDLGIAGLTLDAIGTSQAELDRLSSRP